MQSGTRPHSRVLPTPGSPMTVTSWTEASRTVRANALSRASSSSRPMNGVRAIGSTSTPNRLRAASARQSGNGLGLALHRDRVELLVLDDVAVAR